MSSAEVMLAQEQAVIRRGSGLRREIESAFGLRETEGTLVLTDRRLVYVHGNEKEEDIRTGAIGGKKLFFADVEELNSMELDSMSVEIPVSKIAKVTGHRKEAVAPKLEVKWADTNMAIRIDEFVQQVTGGSRKKNLNDWARVIDKLRTRQLRITPLPTAPGEGTLEGRALVVLGDMQDKGALTIEEEVEGKYKVDLDPDAVDAALAKLVALGLVKRFAPKDEGPYFRKASPLGDEDLSA